MSRTKAAVGQKVKRGEVIGYVGSTGKSTGTHLHYEVIRGGAPVNPVYYFFNDVTVDMYAKMVERSQNSGQSLD
jgi:murein DD-endopeptidase MepM/ murein hydrolase activator NlpD